MKPLDDIPLGAIERAAQRIDGRVLRSPLIFFERDDEGREIHLKLENLQPIGSFKLRGATNAVLAQAKAAGEAGVYTASAGNMAQGIAFAARQEGIPCRVVVPEKAPRAKLEAVQALGATLVPTSFDAWWTAMLEHRFPGENGQFIHPVSNADVIAGNATLGLEILEDFPDVDAVVAPFGGGGLSCGIAMALHAHRSHARVFGAEVSTAAPLSASLAKGEATTIDHLPSFVDGIGGKSVLPEMWPMIQRNLAGSVVVTLEQIAEAIVTLVRRARVVAEGAGAASLAAAHWGRLDARKIVCVISGGNLDPDTLATLLGGSIPAPR